MIGKLFIITAPSGVGKTMLIDTFLEQHSQNGRFQKIITYTTRHPRPLEIPGKDYHFISEQEFHNKISSGFFIEHSSAYGNSYGSSWEFAQKIEEGVSFFAILDFQGAQAIKQKLPAAVTLFLSPPTFAELKKRIEKRDGQKDAPSLQLRLKKLEQELASLPPVDFFDHVFCDESFEKRAESFKSFIFSKLFLKS